jgi:alpha-L-arabinofuranosidase
MAAQPGTAVDLRAPRGRGFGGREMILTPTYHVFRMYVPFQDATSMPVSFDPGTNAHGDVQLPRLDAIAARDKNGKLWLAATNIDAVHPVRIEIVSDGRHISAASGQILTALRIDSVNTFDAPHAVEPKPIAVRASDGKIALQLAPASVTVVELGE